MYELSTTSADGVSIGEPRSERVQTDLDERVTGEWNEQEVRRCPVGRFVDRACVSCERLYRVNSQRAAGADCGPSAW